MTQEEKQLLLKDLSARLPYGVKFHYKRLLDTQFDEDVDDDKYTEEYSETEPYETKAEEVADNEVKPLFDSDPNVLDDNIAFKPIDFNAAGDTHVAPMVTPEPLSFTPPSGTDTTPNNLESENAAPMLDSLTSVSQPTTEERIDVTATVEPASPDASVVTDSPEQTIDVVVETQPAPEPIHVEPITPVRPVSPITGSDVSSTDVRYTKRPTLIYYVMLILLIGLSIFTLWLYQQKNGAVVPDLAATTVASDITTKSTTGEIQETNIPSPFVNVDADQKEPEPVVEPASVETVVPDAVAEVVDDTPIQDVPAVVESEPVAVAVEPEPEPVAQESESVNVSVDSPFVDIRTVATYEPEKKPIPTEEEILARKPGYSVSQQDKMFVAAPEYDTETNVSSYNDYSLDTDVQPINVPEIVTSEVGAVVTDTGCANGASADEYGCCPGEIYLYTQDGYMCCSDDDCFPPLQ